MNSEAMSKGTIVTLLAALAMAVLCSAGAVAVPFCTQFSGANYIDLGFGSSLHFQNEITLEAWIWAPAIADDSLGSIVSSQYDANASGSSIMLDTRLNPDGMLAARRHIHFQIGDGNPADSWHCTNSNAWVPENQWVHIAATRAANQPGRIYYNGVLQPSASKPWTGNINYSANWSIGRQMGMNRFFQGKVDDVRIWSRALSQAEIQDYMLRPLTGTEPGLAGYWRLDEGAGTTTADATGHGNTGTLVNTPVWLASDLYTSIQPDAQIKGATDAKYLGEGTYGDLPKKIQSMPRGLAAIYQVRVVNKRVAPDRFTIGGPAGGGGWTVRYFNDSMGGIEITPVVVAGWQTPIVAPGDSVQLRIEVTADSTVAVGAGNTLVLNAVSTSDPGKSDAVKASSIVIAGEPTPTGKLYTLDADFDQGTLAGLDHATAHNQLQIGTGLATLPYIWVPNSNEGTVSKIDSTTGRELARYRVSLSTNGQPSRTTVDQMGNCWVANRQIGTLVKIGLFENGQWIDRNGDGICQTSKDLDGDGIISTAETLPWGQDECVEYEVVLIAGSEGTFAPGGFTGTYANDYWTPGPRGVAVGRDNNVWVGTYGTSKYYLVNGDNAQIMRVVDVSSANHTPYGAVIDRHGILWSAGETKNNLLWLDTSSYAFGAIQTGYYTYGLGIDWSDRLFVSGYSSLKLSRYNVVAKALDWSIPSAMKSKGVAVTTDGDVWTGDLILNNVSRWSNDGMLKAIIPVGMVPTGMSVDAAGKVWVLSESDERLQRIDPATNTVDLTKRIPGTNHYGYSDMTGIISRSVTTKLGTWTVIHDSRAVDTDWGTVAWAGIAPPPSSSITVRARSSNDGSSWGDWMPAPNGVALGGVRKGRFLQVEVTLRMTPGYASPMLYDLTVIPAAKIASITGARSGSDGDTAFITGKPVSGAFGDFFYMEDQDRTSGIRVNKPAHGLAVGQTASVFGVLRTNDGGERYIDASTASAAGAGSVKPLGMTNRSLDGSGINNIGLLVTVWGNVTQDHGTWFTVSDGSGAEVKCVAPSGVSVGSTPAFVGVTGISSCEKVNGEVHRLILVRTQSDIQPY